MHIRKKFFSLLLVAVLVCSLLPFTAATADAAEDEAYIRNDLSMTLQEATTINNDYQNQSFITNINPFICIRLDDGLLEYNAYKPGYHNAKDIGSDISSGNVLSTIDYNLFFPYGCTNYYTLVNDKGDPADFNIDTGHVFIGMVYQSCSGTIKSIGMTPSKDIEAYRAAITDIITSSENAEFITRGDITYERIHGLRYSTGDYPVREYNTEHIYDREDPGKDYIDMNRMAGGDNIYVYITRDARAGNPITGISFDRGKGHWYNYPVCNIDSKEIQDFNAGTGDDACYLWYERYTYSKSEIASAQNIVNGQNGTVAYQSPVYENDSFTGFEEKVCSSCSDAKNSVNTEYGYYTDYRDGRGYSALWGIDGQDTWYVASGEVTVPDSVAVFGNVHLILEDGCNLTVNSGGGAGIKVPVGCSLTIYGQSGGTGSLTVNGGSDGAGIGCDEGHGAIVINGGNITANGGSNGAGLGGSKNSDGGNLTVNGGTVIATGGSGAAGIGGGFGGEGNNVVINGGTVTATGNTVAGMAMGGAGIGGGSGSDAAGGGNGRNILINNGVVTATGGAGGAGIGGGSYSGTGYYIYINGGTVSAYGSTNAAGIGGGWGGNGTDIGIGGGTVNAFGGEGGTGIGGGYAGTACNISIGSAFVIAKAGNTHDTAIGCGLESVTPASNITISTDMQIKNEDTSDVISNTGEDMASTLSGIQNLSVSENAQTGSVFTNVNSVFLIAGVVLLLIAIGAVFVILKKKKNGVSGD